MVTVAQKSLADQAYDAIEDMITSQQITSATLVSEASLMEATGLGRTPVREALQRLARDRVVQIHPNRGVFVPEITVESQLRLLEIRRPLEALAVELACVRAKRAERDAMGKMLAYLQAAEFTLEGYADSVKQTHQLISKATHNEFLVDAMTPLQTLSRRFWLVNIDDEQDEIAAGARAHAEILTSIIERDAVRAVAASFALNDYLVRHAHRTVGIPQSA